MLSFQFVYRQFVPWRDYSEICGRIFVNFGKWYKELWQVVLPSVL